VIKENHFKNCLINSFSLRHETNNDFTLPIVLGPSRIAFETS
jgi:hypothetical protein